MKRDWGITFAKVVSVLLCIGSFWWMAYSIRDHYHLQHLCTCSLKWEYLPFGASFFAVLFALAMLSKKATAGAAAVILPFATLVIEKFGRRKGDAVSMTVHPAGDQDPVEIAKEVAKQMGGTVVDPGKANPDEIGGA